MSRGFLDQPTICVSAVPGAMGAYLGALLYHAANASAPAPQYNVFASVSAWPSQMTWKTFESYARNSSIDRLRELILADTSQDTEQQGIQVVVSQYLSPAQLSDLFPNSVHIKISVTDQDIAQIGYNALFYEFYHGNGSQDIDEALAYVSDFLGISQEKYDWLNLLDDMLHRDNLAVRMAAMRIGKLSVAACAAQDNANASILDYAKIFPYWKADRPAAGLEISNLFSTLDQVQRDPADMSAMWQALVEKINQIQPYK